MCEKCNKKIPDLNEEKRAQEKIDKYYLYFFKYLFFSFIAFFISYTLAVLIVLGGFFTENFILFLIYIAYFISLIYFIIKYHLLALIVIPL